MKRALILIVCLLAVCAMSAQAETLKWDASTGEVTNYIVYYYDGVNPTWSTTVGNVTEVDIAEFNLDPGVMYTFAVTAMNDFGESGLSNEVEFTLPPWTPTLNPKPANFAIPPTPILQVL